MAKANKAQQRRCRVVERIVKEIVNVATGDFEKTRHLQQLRILAQLRNLAPENLQIMDSIANYVSEENDILYRRGELKGEEKKNQEFILKLINKMGWADDKIAEWVEVPLEFVKKVRIEQIKK